MKTCIIFMNCHGSAIINYLKCSKNFIDIYHVKHIVTHNNLNLIEIEQFSSCDLLITNNIKNYPGINYSDLITYIKSDCKIIKIEYYRFNGFWPNQQSITHKFFGNFFNPNQFKNYDEYINMEIDDSLILNHFNEACEKIKQLDLNSDIKIFDIFIKNFKNFSTFCDSNHPTNFIFKYISQEILNKLNIYDELNYLSDNMYVTSYRHNIICNKVAKVLNLNYNLDSFYLLGNIVDRYTTYNFYKEILFNKEKDNILTWDNLTQEFFLFKNKKNSCVIIKDS